MKPVKDLILFLLLLSFFTSCKKDSFTDSPTAFLRPTADTLHFDTVFTTTGSVSQLVKLVNNNDEGIRINSVRLAGGAASSFRINVDGLPGPVVNNIPVAANDSIYIFATVTINPNAANLPFLVRDSIEISYNGNKKWIQLDAYGQNAHFFRNRTITGNEVWNNDLPYVILDQLTVDTTASLVISKGCRVYIHADAPFFIHGSMQVNGEKWDSTRVVFNGDRLDEPYKDFPASWPGLYFTDASHDNVLNFAVIKNAYQAVVVTGPAPGTKLSLNETIIDNAYDAGITAVNTSITARNLLVSNCGRNMLLAKGGTYRFTHLTSVAESNNYIQHRQPLLVLTDFINIGGVAVTAPLDAEFVNCILWGEANGVVPEEVVVLKEGSATPHVLFDQVLWQLAAPPAYSTVMGAIVNQPPLFDPPAGEMFYDYPIKEESPAREKGKSTPVIRDIRGNPRPFGLPDLGSMEVQQ